MPDKRLENSEPGAVQTLRDLVENLDRLEKDYKATVERHRRFQRLVLVAAALIALTMGGLAYTALSVRGIVTYIADCQDPNGECARKGNARVGAAVAQINENVFLSSIYFGECARSLPDITGKEYEVKLRACVAAKRKAEAPR